MMYHMSIAWIVMFNFLNALHDNCITRNIIETEPLFSKESNLRTAKEYLPLSKLPELHSELRMVDVPEVWKDRIPEPMSYEACLEKQNAKTVATKKFTKDSSLTCYYAWIVNTMLKVDTPKQINSKVKPYLVKNQGWSAFSSVPKVKPGGWIVNGGRGSFFELKFSDVPTSVKSLTIIYMQSYSPMWMNSTLQIDCIFHSPTNDVGASDMKQIVSNTLHVLDHNYTPGLVKRTESYSTTSYALSGYHDEETSILVPIKLSLPDRTEEEGKSMLRLYFRLLDGQTFKIAGVALC
jgi:hypothetical protein